MSNTEQTWPPLAERIERLSEWMQRMRPGPWQLAAINPAKKGAPRCAIIDANDKVALAAFISQYDGRFNIYFSVNSVRSDLTKKAERTDIVQVDFLHVDIDPEADAAAMPLKLQRERILTSLVERLPKGIPAPTTVVFSGGGYQAFWKLAAPLPIDCNLEAAETAKLYNVELERRFAADTCHNVDRLMRLPYTINVPDEKKLAKGRTTELAVVAEADWSRVYDISVFARGRADLVPTAKKGKKERQKIELPPDLPKVAAIDELDRWRVPARVKAIVVQGHFRDEEGPKETDDSRSAWMFDAVCNLVRRKVPPDIIASLLLDPKWGVSAHVLEQGGAAYRYAKRQLERAVEAVGEEGGGLLRMFAEMVLDSFATRVIRFMGVYYEFRDGRYVEVEKEAMRKAVVEVCGGDTDTSAITNVLEHVNALTLVPSTDGVAPPMFIDGRNADVRDYIVCRNGIVEVATGRLLPHDDNLFVLSALPIDYDPNAGEPLVYKRFIETVIPADARETAEYILADLLNPNPKMHYIYNFIGGGGSGKSTMGALQQMLVGEPNVAYLQTHELAQQHGQEGLIGKPLIQFHEMVIPSRGNDAVIALGRLKAMSGNDPVAIQRKYKSAWNGRLNARMVNISNKVPKWPDNSTAIQRRMRFISMPFSFYEGTASVPEDRDMADKLRAELPAILKHLIAKRRTMPAHIESPPSARSLVEGSKAAIHLFVEEECVLDREAQVGKREVFDRFSQWCDYNCPSERMDFTQFNAALREARTTIREKHARQNGDRTRVWVGLRLTPKDDVPF
ncbi:MAG: phage/plasmid primase, P4 family [Hyphomicrobiaceae bacterium]